MVQEKQTFTTFKHTAEGMLANEEGKFPYVSTNEVDSYIAERIARLEKMNETEQGSIEKGNLSDYYKGICQATIDKNEAVIQELKRLRRKLG